MFSIIIIFLFLWAWWKEDRKPFFSIFYLITKLESRFWNVVILQFGRSLKLKNNLTLRCYMEVLLNFHFKCSLSPLCFPPYCIDLGVIETSHNFIYAHLCYFWTNTGNLECLVVATSYPKCDRFYCGTLKFGTGAWGRCMPGVGQ